jgi:hypothetical protein
MNVTRRALLISNPGEDGAENYCRGVFVDIGNYRRLLCAPHGGAWRHDEIAYLHRPSKTELRQAVSGLAPYTYSFVAFCGHGWYSSKELCNVLTLRKGEEMASHELLAGASRRTAVLDCCRKIYHETISESEKKAMAMTRAAAAILRQADPYKCRNLFSALAAGASSGVVEISSCGIGETAGDDDTQGGRYTSSLVAVADAWAEEEAKKPSWTSDSWLSIVGAHNPATDMTRRRSGGTQNPTIARPRSGDYFPFTVFAS